MAPHVFSLHELLLDVVSDQGPLFASALLIRATASLTSGFHPQSGQTKRKNQDIDVALQEAASQVPLSLPYTENHQSGGCEVKVDLVYACSSLVSYFNGQRA